MFHKFNKRDRRRMQEEVKRAYDFDPKDPLFGLSKAEISGPGMSRRTVLRLMAAAGALTMADVLSACVAVPVEQPAASQEAAAPAEKMGGELTAGWAGGAGEVGTLDPAQITHVYQFQVSSNVLGGLTHITPELIGEGDLASGWEVTDDGLEWTFFLREGVTFHNGDPFTADDVIFTFNRSKDPEQSFHAGVLDNVQDIQKVDDLTVRILLARPQASLLVKTLERSSGRAMTIVNQTALEEMGPEQYGLTPVGTGPFRVTEHELGQRIVLERFEDYYDPERPKLDKVTIIPIAENEPLAAAIEAGDIQLIGGEPPGAELIDRFEANPELVVSVEPGPGFESIFINPWREPFVTTDFNKPLEELKQEPGFMVRLALAKALDRDTFVERALFGRGVAAYGAVNPAMRFYFDPELEEKSEQSFDVEEARRLLAEAGYPNGEGFPPVQMQLIPTRRRAGEILVNMFKENLNIDIELDVRDTAVQLENRHTMDFDLSFTGSGGDFDPDDALVDFWQTESKFNGQSRDTAEMAFGYFSDNTADELIDEQSVQADPEQRKALVQEANLLISNKVATAFLYHPVDVLVYRNTVTFPVKSRIPGLVDLDRVTIE